MITQGREAGHGNRDYPWDEFNPVEYFKFNYVDLRDDDKEIVEVVRDFLTRKLEPTIPPGGRRGIDVGTGANLYPTLTMLPFCDEITLYEYSEANVNWLREQHRDGWPSWAEAWRQFWQLLCVREPYRKISDPVAELSSPGRLKITKGDVFALTEEEKFDLGTMFFVAESITGQHMEFLKAMDRFFTLLKPNAVFAMAFMEHSRGYHVGSQQFPATDIGEQDVWDCLRVRASDFSLHRLSAEDKPLRDHYTGMIVAHGRIKRLSESSDKPMDGDS